MTVSTSAVDSVRSGKQLAFQRTVDRSLIHRHALSEVFLTDSVETDDASYLAAARLPSSHAYYTDHVGHTGIDPLLLLECARQAETYGAHMHLGVSRHTKFILRSWSMRVPGLFAAHAGEAADLVMSVATRQGGGARGPARSLTYDIQLSLSGVPAGDVQIEVGYLTNAAYEHVRTLRRGSTPPFSDKVRATSSDVAPAAVGRAGEVNTILVNPVRSGEEISAGIRLPVDNRSMFDHPQDHLPGMVLTEAARQLCLYAGSVLFGLKATEATVVDFDLTFSRFAELDAPITVTASTQDKGAGGAHTFVVSVRQDDHVIAHGAMTSCAVPTTHQTNS